MADLDAMALAIAKGDGGNGVRAMLAHGEREAGRAVLSAAQHDDGLLERSLFHLKRYGQLPTSNQCPLHAYDTTFGQNSENCGGAVGRKDRDQLLDLRPDAARGDAEIVVRLKVQPELRLHLEILSETERRVGGNGPFPTHYRVDARRGDMQIQRKTRLADAQRHKKLLLKYLARMYQVLIAHNCLLNDSQRFQHSWR